MFISPFDVSPLIIIVGMGMGEVITPEAGSQRRRWAEAAPPWAEAEDPLVGRFRRHPRTPWPQPRR